VDTRHAKGTYCLNEGWWVRTGAGLELGGEALSRPRRERDVKREGVWHQVDVPATVLGTLVESGVIADPFFGMNLRAIPGQGPPAQNFSNHPMPDDSPFNAPWWFVKEFVVPADAGPHLALQLDGVNYRANLWLNGQRLADTGELAGAYRVYELDVTDKLSRDGINVLALEIFPPDPCDLAITWVDWNPSPPDKNMGIWRDVWLRSHGPVGLRDPYVTTRLQGENGSTRALVTVAGDLVSQAATPVTAVVEAELVGRTLRQEVTLAPGERKRFELETFALSEPKLWWPRTMGEPTLHELAVRVSVDGAPSDGSEQKVGLREVTSTLTDEGHALFRINGEPVQIRGAGWASDLFLRRNPERERAQLEYVKALHLNTIRFEGVLERAEFLEWCDRDGVLVIAGWCCCDCWEKWDKWREENYGIAAESLRSQVRRVRRHPSLIAWWYGSDFAPPTRVEQSYLDVFAQEGWPNAFHSSAANKPTELTGPSGLKMEGPYEYVPPTYWLEDEKRGGAWGFATEISPGPAIPPLESLKKMLPAEHLWPIDDVWRFHAGGQDFHQVKFFAEALEQRYGHMAGVDEFAFWSQVATYEGQRAMFEGYSQRKYRATGVIQWMLNNAWPSLIWHLYDYYLRPAGGFFGTVKGCEPLHVQLDPAGRGVFVLNERRRGERGLRVEARVLDLSGREKHLQAASVDVGPDGKVQAFVLPAVDTGPVSFVDLRLVAAGGELVSRNFYWLPLTPDVLDHEQNMWMHTPCASFADMSALRQLAPAPLGVRVAHDPADRQHALQVELRNATDRLAFFTQLRLEDGKGDDLLPALWDDNYVSLLPGERRVLRVRVLPTRVLPADVRIEVRGANVPRVRVAPERPRAGAGERDPVFT
jgi:exo-1,4-beta-D-glucosaminidase